MGGESMDARPPSSSVVHDGTVGMVVVAESRPGVVWLLFIFIFFFFFFFFLFFFFFFFSSFFSSAALERKGEGRLGGS
jgi:hypothetical protein